MWDQLQEFVQIRIITGTQSRKRKSFKTGFFYTSDNVLKIFSQGSEPVGGIVGFSLTEPAIFRTTPGYFYIQPVKYHIAQGNNYPVTRERFPNALYYPLLDGTAFQVRGIKPTFFYRGVKSRDIYTFNVIQPA